MKKILLSALCLGLATTVMLASCGKEDETKTNEKQQQTQVENTTAENDAPEIVIPEEQLDYEVEIDSFALTATITDYKGNAEQVEVPETVVDPDYGDVYPVVAIGSGAFLGNETLTEISFPKTLTSIEEGAFQNCSALKKVTLPDGFKRIAAKAFYNSGLEEINIPKTVTEIGNFAFSTQLNETPWYTAQKEPQVIVGDGILLKYNGTEDVELKDEIKHIAYYAFSEAGAITVTLPAGIESIDSNAIFEADNQTEIVFLAPYGSTTVETLSMTTLKYEVFGEPVAEEAQADAEAQAE